MPSPGPGAWRRNWGRWHDHAGARPAAARAQPDPGRRQDGAAGDLPAGLGGRQSQGGGAQGQGNLTDRADRFAAALRGVGAVPQGAAPQAAAPAASPAAQLPPDAAPEAKADTALPMGTGGAAVPLAAAAPTADPAPLLPAGTAHAEAVADITRRVVAELRAAEAPSGPLAQGGVVKPALDLGRTALGVTGLRLEIGPQALVLVLSVPPGGAAHDLPQAVQALSARFPQRAVRVETQDGAPEGEGASAGPRPAGFDPYRPWSGGAA